MLATRLSRMPSAGRLSASSAPARHSRISTAGGARNPYETRSAIRLCCHSEALAEAREPGTQEHGPTTPIGRRGLLSRCGVHGFRARGLHPRPGMTVFWLFPALVTGADEAQMVAEMRPHLVGPGCVGGALPGWGGL